MGLVCPGGELQVQKCEADLTPLVGPTGIQFKGPYPDESYELEPTEIGKINNIADVLKQNYTIFGIKSCGIRIMCYQPAGCYKRWKTPEQCRDLMMLRGNAIRKALQVEELGVSTPITVKPNPEGTPAPGTSFELHGTNTLCVLVPVAPMSDIQKEIEEEPKYSETIPDWTDIEEGQWMCDNIILNEPVPFKGNSYSLEPSSTIQVADLADMLKKIPSIGIRLVGFTGKTGEHNKWKTEKHLENLGNLRMRALRNALRKTHKVENPIAVVGKGDHDSYYKKGARVESAVNTAGDVHAEELNEGPAPPEHEDDIYDGQWLRKKNLEDIADIIDGKMKWRGQDKEPWSIKIDDDTHAISMLDPSDKEKPCTGSMKNGALVWGDGDVWVRAPTEATPQDYVTTHKDPAKIREGWDVKTKMLTKLKNGTPVRVVEVQGRRARIISPINGWLSTRQETTESKQGYFMILERA
jgi:outer membrane protein OmpA-like peptidoglycan-associated protein